MLTFVNVFFFFLFFSKDWTSDVVGTFFRAVKCINLRKNVSFCTAVVFASDNEAATSQIATTTTACKEIKSNYEIAYYLDCSKQGKGNWMYKTIPSQLRPAKLPVREAECRLIFPSTVILDFWPSQCHLLNSKPGYFLGIRQSDFRERWGGNFIFHHGVCYRHHTSTPKHVKQTVPIETFLRILILFFIHLQRGNHWLVQWHPWSCATCWPGRQQLIPSTTFLLQMML